ncbi:MAG: long-chain fatty acid--CoA ligase [Proteobacteria bacterium]|nr:long-chain fatty acid--CoA ligase [Pseudomonadota bacterium]
MEERVWHKFYVPQVSPSMDYERTPLPMSLERTAKNWPDNTAVVMMGKKISYREMDVLVSRFARAMSELGIGKGDKVALILPNMPQMIIATYAAFRLGAVVVMNNPLYTERELEHQLNDSGSKMVVCMDLLVPRLLSLKARAGIETIISCHIRDYLPFPLKQLFPVLKKGMHRPTDPKEGVLDFMDLIGRYPAQPPRTDVGFDDLAALLYTGGTTGVSKGVMLTHANISINVQQISAWLYDAKDGRETVIGILPFFHSAGFTAGMNQCIYRGFTHVMVPRPDVDILRKYLVKYRPALFGCVPTLYVGLLNHPKLPPKSELGFIKGCISGAAPLALETIREWDARVGAQIVEVYGMTEMSPVSHANPWGGQTKPGSVGIPFPDTDCRIVDVETGEQELGVGESGEILLKGPQQMQGYYNRPDETADAIRDGWFYTGDIGYMDDDGFLYIVDRKKDMIIAGGYNIYPRDIDEVLYEHPKVQEACAVGLPDPYRGETVKAFIALKPGEAMSEAEVIEYCKTKLATYKVPKSVEFLSELPKSVIGKVLRRELRDMEMKKTQ